MAGTRVRAEQPLGAFYFILGGLFAGLLLGLVAGLVSGVIMGQTGMMRWLHPQITGRTNFDLALFFFEVIFLPILLALVFGVGLPLGYFHAKFNARRSFSMVSAQAVVLGGLMLAVVFLFIGVRYWYVMAAVHLLVLLPLSAALTAFQVSMYRAQLLKIPELPTEQAESSPPDKPAASSADRLATLSQALAAHQAAQRRED